MFSSPSPVMAPHTFLPILLKARGEGQWLKMNETRLTFQPKRKGSLGNNTRDLQRASISEPCFIKWAGFRSGQGAGPIVGVRGSGACPTETAR